MRRITSSTLIVFALLGGIAALLVTLQGSIVAGIVTGLVVLLISLVGIAAALRRAAAEVYR